MADSLAILLILIGLELVLGVDNILVISIFVAKIPEKHRHRARLLGLGFALIARIIMLVVLIKLAGLTQNVLLHFSIRDLILISGGLFLLWKAVVEIHHTVEIKDESESQPKADVSRGVVAVVLQIVLLDIVFSVDSVITAIGLTGEIWVIISSVLVSFLFILAFARQIGDFILSHPTVKILALSFLITIGVTIFMEGMHKDVPKAYIYLPMGFAMFVEMLQLRYEYNKKKVISNG